jgi:prepilin-type N-terminal cleavage/methylation domain-containing protein
MSRSRGFSLLELLIGLTLLGFLLAILYGGFRLAANSWEMTEGRTATAADQEAGRAAIRRLIVEAQPFHLTAAPGQSLAFEGSRDALRLVAPIGRIGPRVVELAIVDGAAAGGTKLLLRHGPVRFDAGRFGDTLDGQASHPVLGGLNKAVFAYFGPEKQGDPPAWHDQWLAQESFPAMVRLHLDHDDGTTFDLDVAPTISGNRLAGTRITAGPQ